VLLIDLPAARDRKAKATAGRRVRFYADPDGQAVLHARGPLAMIAAIKASLDATLGRRVQGDDRSHDEREFDLFVDLLTGSEVPSGWHAHVVVPFTTALGGETELADVPGFGPILPSTARDLVEDAVALTQVAVDQDGTVFAVGDVLNPAPAPAPTEAPVAAGRPQTPAAQGDAAPADAVREAILAMGNAPDDRTRSSNLATSAYRTPTRLVRFLQARDLTCVFPHCTRRVTDVDHRTPWPLGATDARNCQLLCRHHHRAKQAAFTVELIDGDYRWTTRGGWQFWRRRQGY
jgi:hypothetical protein